MKKICILLMACQAMVACNKPIEAQEQTTLEGKEVTVFQNVNVITMESDQVLGGQDVVIVDGVIEFISPSAEYPNHAQIIDGTDQYLLPGLAEMHAHIPTDQDQELVEETLFLYLAGGVTTIRGMLGHPSHLTLRVQVNEGKVLGPHIYTSGPSINGNSAPDEETVSNMVRQQKEAGYDFLKIHPGLTMEVFDALVRTANEVDITFSGHVSRAVGIRHAIASRYASIDHLDQYVEGLVPEEAAVDPQDNGFFGMNFTDLADESLLGELIQSSKEQGVWVVPTQCLAERWAGPVSPEEMAASPEMKFMPASTLERWVQSKKQMQGSNYDPQKAQRFIELRRRMIKAMNDGGMGILLGSDAPQVFNVPGFAIQHEIEMYVAAGLTPYEALITGTVNPAKFFGTSKERGMVKEGYQADLILVKGNPLEDIKNLSQREGVMIRGEWLSKNVIEERLAQLAAKYAGP
ncbi:MAG: amidohydrolase family protein [Cyclobacteriaceae bacterium]|nr:amidohydrolase family protein [Cyclobacteriaceae bacterium]